MATRANILIVDDDKDQLDLFGLLLEKAKFKAFKALSVDEAMQILECEKVDCVVLDVFMPTTSGQVFTQYLRAHDALQDIPIIMLTAGSEELEMDLMISGADLFCQKQDASKKLVSQIELLLGL